MLEAATLGMPFEVWKTRMGRFRNENTIQAFRGVYQNGGGGLKGLFSPLESVFNPDLNESVHAASSKRGTASKGSLTTNSQQQDYFCRCHDLALARARYLCSGGCFHTV